MLAQIKEFRLDQKLIDEFLPEVVEALYEKYPSRIHNLLVEAYLEHETKDCQDVSLLDEWFSTHFSDQLIGTMSRQQLEVGLTQIPFSGIPGIKIRETHYDGRITIQVSASLVTYLNQFGKDYPPHSPPEHTIDLLELEAFLQTCLCAGEIELVKIHEEGVTFKASPGEDIGDYLPTHLLHGQGTPNFFTPILTSFDLPQTNDLLAWFSQPFPIGPGMYINAYKCTHHFRREFQSDDLEVTGRGTGATFKSNSEEIMQGLYKYFSSISVSFQVNQCRIVVEDFDCFYQML